MKITPARPTQSRTTSQTTEITTTSLEERIRTRAYELFEQRGRQDGHEIEDWLQAELEVTQPASNKADAVAA